MINLRKVVRGGNIMKNKQLLELLKNYLLKIENKDTIFQYIKTHNISNNDMNKLEKVLSMGNFWEYVNLNNIEKIIDNIDNENFMNNENNFI